MKRVFKLSLCAVLIAGVMGCSDSRSRSQASDGFQYLETSSLKTWTALPEQKPEFSGVYRIPENEYSGNIGDKVDIRPPLQVFELIPGMRFERLSNSITVWMPGKNDAQRLGMVIEQLVESGQIPTIKMEDDGVESDWIKWSLEDEKPRIETRHNLTPIKNSTNYGFKVEMLGFMQDGVEMASPLPPEILERYNTMMSNLITTNYDLELRALARLRARDSTKNIPISIGKDRSAMPVIIARAPYDAFWERLPEILIPLGFTIDERNNSQGVLKLSYSAPNEAHWKKTGIKPFVLERNNYIVQLGDLGNRTSLNVTNKDGKPISEELLKEFSFALEATLEYIN